MKVDEIGDNQNADDVDAKHKNLLKRQSALKVAQVVDDEGNMVTGKLMNVAPTKLDDVDCDSDDEVDYFQDVCKTFAKAKSKAKPVDAAPKEAVVATSATLATKMTTPRTGEVHVFLTELFQLMLGGKEDKKKKLPGPHTQLLELSKTALENHKAKIVLTAVSTDVGFHTYTDTEVNKNSSALKKRLLPDLMIIYNAVHTQNVFEFIDESSKPASITSSDMSVFSREITNEAIYLQNSLDAISSLMATCREPPKKKQKTTSMANSVMPEPVAMRHSILETEMGKIARP